jgi:hypothetical protein
VFPHSVSGKDLNNNCIPNFISKLYYSIFSLRFYLVTNDLSGFAESASSFEGMPTGLPLLQCHSKHLSKLICSLTHKDNFMETPQALQNIFSFQPPLVQLYENLLEL